MTHPTRPAVTVVPVTTETGDYSHCSITVGTATFDALFTQSHPQLKDMIQAATSVELTTPELMVVNKASRWQMEREADRLKSVLQGMPDGTLALVKDGLYFWLDSTGELYWSEWMTVGGSPHDINPAHIQEVGDIDTDELHAVAENIRAWLQEPSTTAVDQGWLRSVEAK